MRIINPQSKINRKETNFGVVTHYVCVPIRNFIESCKNSDAFVKRELGSRLSYLLLLVAAVFTRILDFLVGIAAIVASFLTGGRYEKVNSFAYLQFKPLAMIADILFCLLSMVNPHMKPYEPELSPAQPNV